MKIETWITAIGVLAVILVFLNEDSKRREQNLFLARLEASLNE